MVMGETLMMNRMARDDRLLIEARTPDRKERVDLLHVRMIVTAVLAVGSLFENVQIVCATRRMNVVGAAREMMQPVKNRHHQYSQ